MSIGRVNISTVNKDDYQDLIVFLSTFESETRDKEFWESKLLFWWEKNPAFSEDIDRGWVLKDLDKNLIVGFIANIPTFFILQGKKIIVNNGSTYRVKKEYRMHSISLYLRWVNYSDQTIHFATTPNQTVIKILKLMKFDKFPNTVEFMNFIPVDLYNLFKYKYNHYKILNDVIRLFKYFPYYIYVTFYKSIFSSSLKVEIITNIDENFDELWFRTKNRYLNTNFRDSKYMNWYCNEFADKNKVMFGCFKDNILKVYALFQVNKGNHIKSLNCLDIWGDEVNIKTLKLIMYKVLIFSKNNNIDTIEFSYINAELDSYCRKIGFLKRRYTKERFFKLKGKSVAKTNFNENTYLPFAQGDIGM